MGEETTPIKVGSMPEIYLLSTLLMGLLLIAVAVVINRSGQRATPSGDAGGRSGFAEWSGRSDVDSSRLVEIASTPMTWTLTFVVLSVVFLAGSVLMIEGVPGVPGLDSGLFETIVLAAGGAVLLGYVFFGAYFAMRDRLGQTAAAVGIASTVLGVLVMIAIVAVLLMA